MALHLATIPVLQHDVIVPNLVSRLSVKPTSAELTAAQKAGFALLNTKLLRLEQQILQYAVALPPHSVLLHYLLKEVITYRNADNPGSLGLLDLLRIGTVGYQLKPSLCLYAPLQLSYPQSLHQLANKLTPYQPSEPPRNNHATFKARDETAHG
ncbi:MAG TPA: hypothetical protein VIN66_01295 [Rheinheimera sp.]|uniref:hypothetical protein n=1 Tax=Rheinheimera sp. TaxID=1869214 RepID=UPI002F95799D